MSGLKREDEYRLKELTQLADERGRHNLTEDQLLQLLLLEDRYNRFLEEGMKKLREAANPQSPRSGIRGLFSSGRSSPPKRDVGGGSDTSSTAAAGTATPQSPLVAPSQEPGKLWTWILEDVVVGGIPYANQTTDTPGHLCELAEQCMQRRAKIAAVVSCLDMEEPIPSGFAAARDWEVQLNVNTFFHVSCIPRDTELINIESLESSPQQGPPPGSAVDAAEPNSPLPSDPAFEEVLSVCQNVSKMCEGSHSGDGKGKLKDGSGLKHRLSIVGAPKAEKRKVVYVHCKAGLSRSWVFCMCFLISQLHKEYDDADSYLKSLRGFDPKPCHIQFVRRFAAYVNSPRFAAHSDEEEKYIRVLAEVLSWSPKYRLKLQHDLEKLT